MNNNSKEDYKQHFVLTLLVSLFVLVIILIVAIITIAVLYLMLRLNIIDSVEGRLKLSTLFLLMPVISAIIGFGITLVINKISLKPVNRLIDQLNRLARGEFKARIHFGQPLSRITDFKEIENSFNIAAEELEHTEMLRYGNLSEEQKKEYLSIIEEESLRLSSMATNVLNLTKIENQMILTDIRTFNLSEQLRSAVLLLAEKWTPKNLDLDMEFGEYMIEANPELLKQVWINLLDNTIQFSEQNGTIAIAITENNGNTSVAIANHGPEIPEKSLDRIFNKFYQVDESHASEGNGIGLAIVKKVTDLHRGSVFVDFRNGLTTFTVTLPSVQ